MAKEPTHRIWRTEQTGLNEVLIFLPSVYVWHVLIGSSGERLEEVRRERLIVKREQIQGLKYGLMVAPVTWRYNTCPGKSR